MAEEAGTNQTAQEAGANQTAVAVPASANGESANADVAGMAGAMAVNPMAAAIAAAQQQAVAQQQALAQQQAALQQAAAAQQAQQAQQGNAEGASAGSVAPAAMNALQMQQLQVQMQMMAAMGMGGHPQMMQYMQMMQQLQAANASGVPGQSTPGQATAAQQDSYQQAQIAQNTARSAPYEQQPQSGGYGGAPSGNLFIGAIPRTLTDDDLRSLFSPLGTIQSCKISVDPMTGNSKGFGFVKYASTEEAAKAIETLNGHSGMQVKFAAHDNSKGGGKGGTISDNLYIRGLPSPQADPEQLIKLFTDLGLTVTRHKLIVDTKGVGSSAAMVQLASKEEAQSAITQLNGKESFGGMLFLSFVEGGKGDDKGMGGFGGTARPLILKVKPAGEDARGDNLFVGGLPSPTVDQAELAKVFEARGWTVVRSKMLTDTRGKGASSALVQLLNRDEANAAIEQLNGQYVEELNLKAVQIPDAYDPSKFDANKMPIHGNLFVGNIPKPFSEQELLKMFEECGKIKSCKISRFPDGESKGSGFVKFETPEEAKIAIDSLHGFNNLVVKPADFDVGNKGKGKDKDWGKDWAAWQQPAWQQPAWQQPAWQKGGKENAKVIPPRVDAGFQPMSLEQPMTASFAGDSGDDKQPSDTVFILGLPSPVVEEHRLLAALSSMGVTPERIETIPDDTDSQCSAAMVTFASVEAASQVRGVVDGKKPAELGLSAKGASKGNVLANVLKGMKGKTFGKGSAPAVVPGPYSPKGWGKGEESGKGWWNGKGEQAKSVSSTAPPGDGSWNSQTVAGSWGPESSSDAPSQVGQAPAQLGQGDQSAPTNSWNSQGSGDGGWSGDRSSWNAAGNGAWGKAEAWPSGGQNGAWSAEGYSGGSSQAWNSQSWPPEGQATVPEP